MSRELRMVPPDWKHPRDHAEVYVPLLKDLGDRLASWHKEKAQWDRGFIRKYLGGWELKSECGYIKDTESFDDWRGECPVAEEYMPDWPAEVCTHFQMYESVSEGTPISPICETAEELAHWLADNGASAFASSTASYKDWLSTIKRGWAISAVGTPGNLRSGVTVMREMEIKDAE